MASARDADTATWLQNKLGSTDDLWSGNSISSQLSKDRLLSIQECFHTLQPTVKVKLLLCFLHVPKRNIDEWKAEIDEILGLALEDSDQWVSMVADIMKVYTASGCLNTDIDDRSNYFHEVITELKKLVKKSTDSSLLPLECQFLSKSAMSSVVGSHSQAAKHFSLKRKPKSAALRAEILQKSAEAANKTSGGGTVPFKMRSFAKTLDDKGPMRGISSPMSHNFREPHRFNNKLSNSVSGRALPKKDCGIKLLDMSEVPVTGKEARRRKRQQEQEAAAAAKKAREEAAAEAESATPAYAAGLGAPANTASVNAAMPVVTSATNTVTYSPSVNHVQRIVLPGSAGTASASDTEANTGATQQVQVQGQKVTLSLTPQQQQALRLNQPTKVTVVRGGVPSQIVVRGGAPVAPNQGQPTQPMVMRMTSPAAGSAPSAPTGTRVVRISAVPQGQGQTAAVQGQPQGQVLQLPRAQGQTVHGQTVQIRGQTYQIQRPPAPGQQAQSVQGQTVQGQTVQGQTVQGQMLQVQNPPAQMQFQKKQSLSLTQEQMLQAQEMFRTSNKVSRPEKALIISFMAGSRENPCPKQGDIVNVLLSEHEDSVPQPDGTFAPMIENVYFQMNFGTGEWKTLKKYRPLEPKE